MFENINQTSNATVTALASVSEDSLYDNHFYIF